MKTKPKGEFTKIWNQLRNKNAQIAPIRATMILLLLITFTIGCASLHREPTADLKLRWNQCVEYLQSEHKGWEFRIGGPPWAGNPREDRVKEKEEIEKELLRRWKAGDKEAYLPIFGANN